MKMDEFGEKATGDSLILSLGENWLRRNIDNDTKRMYYALQHMRGAAKLLSEVNKINGREDTSMTKVLRPRYFDDVIQAALNYALQIIDDDEEELKAPSNSIRIKYDLISMSSLKKTGAMKILDACENDEDSEMTDDGKKAQKEKSQAD